MCDSKLVPLIFDSSEDIVKIILYCCYRRSITLSCHIAWQKDVRNMAVTTWESVLASLGVQLMLLIPSASRVGVDFI